MNGKIFNMYTLLIGISVTILAVTGANHDGKYRNSKYNKNNSGKYVASNEGRYVPMSWPYMHVDDNRNLGKYVHVHIPYDGGYGPYSGDIDKYRYLNDASGQYSNDKYTVSNLGNPFNNINAYDIPKPDILLEYGFPNHSPKVKRSISTHANQQYLLANALPIQYFTNSQHQQNKNLIDSQTTTTTTPKPRIRYDDEGKWRIIRQEEMKNQKKYDFLYLTENGIYAEEQAKLVNNNHKADGTNNKGYYEYTGDDGELYRVVYTAGEQGFMAQGAHIPTPPPIPEAIQKALAYVEAKERAANGYKH